MADPYQIEVHLVSEQSPELIKKIETHVDIHFGPSMSRLGKFLTLQIALIATLMITVNITSVSPTKMLLLQWMVRSFL